MDKLGASFRSGMFAKYMEDYLATHDAEALILFKSKFVGKILQGKIVNFNKNRL